MTPELHLNGSGAAAVACSRGESTNFAVLNCVTSVCHPVDSEPVPGKAVQRARERRSPLTFLGWPPYCAPSMRHNPGTVPTLALSSLEDLAGLHLLNLGLGLLLLILALISFSQPGTL